ncbi:uncharacterized protein LOC141690301 [Apium graveolens]|uniref:uncharacterized protein LOC141690301 n=1 Tax=Apium graveolens TaxID=4045 RepID=UPI003D7AAD38
MAYSLLLAIQKLRPYFQGHDIRVYTNQPLWKILHKPDLFGRLVNRAVELSQFNISYLYRQSIRGQALADFLTECSAPLESETPPEDSPKLAQLPIPWLLFVDGSSTSDSSEAGVLLVSPGGFEFQQSIRFNFPATNNCSEYEALLAGLRLAKFLQVQHLKVNSNSQLIVNYVLGGFTTKSPLIIKYLEETKSQLLEFKIATLEGILRGENQRADILEKLATDEDLSPSIGLYKVLLPSPSVAPLDETTLEVLTLYYGPNWMTQIHLKQFVETEFEEYLTAYGIQHRRSSVAYPQANGQVEVTNRTLLQSLRKNVQDSKSLWVKELPNMLWAYRTNTRKPTGESPFRLTYGTEALVPVEVGEPSTQVQNYNPKLNQ